MNYLPTITRNHRARWGWRIFVGTVVLFLWPMSVLSSPADTLFFADWESGQGIWFADNGVWEWGSPTVGPDTAHSGQYLMGTILDGNYPPNANTRLISPSMALPGIQGQEEIRLYFWHWFRSQEVGDPAYVQISVEGGPWVTISDQINGLSPVWTRAGVDLSSYSDSTVRIGFYFTSDGGGGEGNGWYVDDISIEHGVFPFPNPEDFEAGIGNWYSDNGLWEWGSPTVGPDTAHSGQYLMGTILDDNYLPNANTRLISPSMALPGIQGEEEIRLYFWHWFRSQEVGDPAYVQISVEGGPWVTISGQINGLSPVWTRAGVDLSSYADSTVRIGFYFTSDGGGGEGNGWYVDDISIEHGVFPFPNPEDFEAGIGNWYSDNGLWEVGMPTVGPDTAYSGVNCAGTDLGADYQPNANTRLISPSLTLDGQNPLLCFKHWFRTQEVGDNGYLEISVSNGPWEMIGGPFNGESPIWTQSCVDLSSYADSTVRIGFYFTADGGGGQGNGWYVDDIEIIGITDIEEDQSELPAEFSLGQNYPNPFNPSTSIEFALPHGGYVKLEVYNLLGERVRVLTDGKRDAGYHAVVFEADGFPSGTYFYRLQTEDFVETKKLMLLK